MSTPDPEDLEGPEGTALREYVYPTSRDSQAHWGYRTVEGSVITACGLTALEEWRQFPDWVPAERKCRWTPCARRWGRWNLARLRRYADRGAGAVGHMNRDRPAR